MTSYQKAIKALEECVKDAMENNIDPGLQSEIWRHYQGMKAIDRQLPDAPKFSFKLDALDDALDYYVKASKINNNYTSPLYLYKAGLLAMKLNKFNRAEEYFSAIKKDYPNSSEAKNIDAFISKAIASDQ